MTRPATPARGGSGFRDRLGYYLLGVAIGCAFTGLIIAARLRAAPPAARPVGEPAAAAAPAANASPAPVPAGPR
ncbi:MAG TPA: hypothetical protein VD963_03720 [Phycisphaerales bacterium]|nr:hypothetical protein [Phycisphaerales bacterium]